VSDIPFDAVRRWCFETALPFWAEVGRDGPGRGFVEQLDLQGRKSEVGFKRVRAQARQVYVYSHAHLLGFEGGLQAARAGYDFLVEHARLADGGWARRLDRDGAVIDATLDLYDQAFVLFALAWTHKASGDPQPLRLAHATMDAVERRLGRPDGRGFAAALPSPGAALQNPHMHLLEASLALHDAEGHERWAALARKLTSLFAEAFFDPETGTLAEDFAESDWRRTLGADGTLIEPGHQFEWVWLLDRAERQVGGDFSAQAAALYSFGSRFGLDPKTGAALDEIDDRGRVRRASARLWPQTELLKARLARAERGDAVDRAGIAATATLILDRYLAPAPAGGWWDQFDADGALIADKIPASSFYHIFVAFTELLRLEPVLEAAAAVPPLGGPAGAPAGGAPGSATVGGGPPSAGSAGLLPPEGGDRGA
jgi:mannose/cellobiose epimerase-like protein (N-acyl-D-glucosamine 2-epimerase family)